jgi:uncharacterized protein (TIGR04255 family)
MLTDRKRNKLIRDPMAPASSLSDRIKFVDPPINELVVALYHLPILELKAQHVGLYWSSIRDRFPSCEQQPGVPSPTSPQPFIEAPGEVFPLPRFRFSSNKHQTLIQIQRNAFMLNWRRTDDTNDYPHYEAVVREFWQELERYAEFVRIDVGGKLDVVQACELNYVNVVPQNELFAAPKDFGSILPLLSGVSDLVGDRRQLAFLNATISYRVTPNLVIDLTARLGRRVEAGNLLLGFELKAHGAPTGLSIDGARVWYNSAHDATYELFLEATSKQAQEKLWKPR